MSIAALQAGDVRGGYFRVDILQGKNGEIILRAQMRAVVGKEKEIEAMIGISGHHLSGSLDMVLSKDT